MAPFQHRLRMAIDPGFEDWKIRLAVWAFHIGIEGHGVGMLLADHCNAVAELHHAFSLDHLGILDDQTASLKGMAAREREAHHPTCSTDRELLRSGRISDVAEIEGTSQSAHASLWRTSLRQHIGFSI